MTKRPRVVKTTELEVEERTPPAPPQWKIFESYPEREAARKPKPPVHAETRMPAGLFAGVGKWISGLFRR